jgi:primosomal replication protein N
VTSPDAGAAVNRIEFDGALVASEGLRFTPGGVAVVDAVLAHRSSQREAGADRRLEFDLAVRFAGEAAHRVAAMPMGRPLRVRGFLAPRRRQSRQLVLHVNAFELIEV